MSNLPARGVVLALCTAILLVACGGDPTAPPLGATFTKDQVKRFVLHKSDLPAGYHEVDAQSGPVDCDSPWLANRGAYEETVEEARLRGELLALEPQACTMSTYEITMGEPPFDGRTGYGAMAIVFPDADSASASLPMLRKSFVDTGDVALGGMPLPEDLDNPGLGEESSGFRWGGVAPAGMTTSSVYIWRVRNVAVVLQGGGTPEADDDEIVQLARKLESHAGA